MSLGAIFLHTPNVHISRTCARYAHSLRSTDATWPLLRRRHTVYMAEANLVGGGQQDLEYSLERRAPCPRPQAVEGEGRSGGPEL